MLYGAGLRYRVEYLIRVGTLSVHPDIVFTRAKIAVFVDGCFWHRCPLHGSTPKTNTDYWSPKLFLQHGQGSASQRGSSDSSGVSRWALGTNLTT